MFRFKEHVNKFSSENLKKFTPYIMIVIFLASVIIPVWANTPTEVSNFAELKAACEAGGNIKVMADIVDEEATCLEITKDVTLDLNGHKLSKTNITSSIAYDKARFFFNVRDGVFTINNSADTIGEINAAGASKTASPRAVAANANGENKHPKVIVNKGVKLSGTNPTIGGYYNRTNYDDANARALGVYTPNDYTTDARKEASSRTSSAEAIINDGAILNSVGPGVVLEGYGAKLTVNGGTINSVKNTINNNAGSEVVINGGILSSSFRNVLYNHKAKITVNDGTFIGLYSDSDYNGHSISNDDDGSDYPDCSETGTVTINGGTFLGEIYNRTGLGNKITIYEGKFTIDASSYLADGATGAWEDKYYVVRSYEQINTEQEFLDAVAAGGNYKLGADIEFTSYVEMFKDFTLDMNGHKLSRTNITSGTKGNVDRYFLIVRNGTFTINNNSATQGQIYAETSNKEGAPRAVAAFANADDCNAKVVVDGDVLIKAYNPYGYDNPETGVNGMVVCTPDSYEDDKYADPTERKMSSEIIINQGTISGTRTAITIEGYGTKLVVNGGTLHGDKHGIANYCGGDVTVNYATVSECKNAITTEKATSVVNDGIFTGTSNAINLWCDSDNKDYSNCSHATETRVNGGTFTGSIEPDQGTILINGGSFTADPTAYKADGATITSEEGYNVVKIGDGCIGTFRQLKLAINNGGEYTLGADIEIPLNADCLEIYNNFTLNMNGYKITKTTNLTSKGNRQILQVYNNTTTINGPGEITNSAVDNEYATPRALVADPDVNEGYAPKLILNGIDGKLKITANGSNKNANQQSAGCTRAVAVWTDSSSNTAESILCTATCVINGDVDVKTSGGHTIALEGYGTKLTVNDGTFNSARNAISNNYGGVVTVNGGTFTAKNNAIYNCKATTNINGGTFTGTNRAIYNDDESEETTPFYPSCNVIPTINIVGGTFDGEIENVDAKLDSKIAISGGKYTADPTAYLEDDCTAVQSEGYYVVSSTAESSAYKVTTDTEGAIPGGTITAKIKVLFKDLEEKAITGIQAVVNYATDILEFVSAEKSSIEGTTTPVTEVAGEIGFGLVSTSGIEFTEGQYYDFGTMTFKVKQGVSAGTISNLFITDATYMLTDYTEKTATTTGADIEIYQPVTNINITSQTGSTTMLVENTLQLEAEILPETAKTKDIEWISGDESIATVDANGLVTAQLISGKTAVVIITAKALDGSGVTGTIQLTVKRPNVASMNFAQAAYELKTDDTTQNLYSELSVAPSTALKPAANEITWSSSNANFAVDENGVVSIVTATEEKQSTTITAKYTNEAGETITATCTVNSKPKKINLNLATKLEGRQSGGGAGTNVELIEVYLYDSANNPLWNGTGTTDTSGNVTFEIDSSIIEEGQSVKLWIKGERYLAKLITQTVTLTGSDWNVTMPAMLKAADSNADNKVNLTDFGILGNSFLKKKGVTGFDARADYNADDKVNLTDFGFLGNNFLNKGDAKPQPAVGMLMAAAARNGTTETALTVLNPDTAKIAEQALANSSSTDEETQEEEILAAVQEATGADLNASKTPASANSSSDSQNNSTGGGCNAGFGAIALLFAMPFIFKKRK